MFKFKRIKIESFYSLGEVELNLEKGLYLVKGYNKDIKSIDNVSNGAGKTSLFNAIYQGLYNKNLKDKEGVIQSVNNKYLNKPYKIEIDFEKNGINYKIINDRNTMDIQIIKDNQNIAPKGIQNALRVIKEQVIGFPFEIFVSLTYLNSAILDNIIELTNKNNILYQFFEIDKLINFQKKVQEFLKEKKGEYKVLEVKYQNAIDMLGFLQKTTESNEFDLLENINYLQNELLKLEESKEQKLISKYQKDLSELNNKVLQTKQELIKIKTETDTYYKQYKTLQQGICPVCHQKIEDNIINEAKVLFENNKQKYYQIKKELEKQEKMKINLQEKIYNLETKLELQKNNLKEQINQLKGQLKQVEQYKELKNKQQELEQEKINLEKVLNTLQQEIEFLNSILKILKSGVLLNKYLEKYVELLRLNLEFYKKFTNFNFNIKVSVGKKGLIYKFVENGVVKTFGQLSSGEKTRVSFLILIATIRALEQLVGIEINFLVIDEILGVLDEEGLDFVKDILNELKKEKAIFIITHHNEIEESDVDYVLSVIKENNISKIELKDL